MAASTLSGVAPSAFAALIVSGTKWVSGGIVSSGWASSIIRSSVVPERFMPTTNGNGLAAGAAAKEIWDQDCHRGRRCYEDGARA